MIVTLTANPSIDRTMVLAAPLLPGEVHRATSVLDQAGGKGVNVARVVALGGRASCAVLPADPEDPVLAGLAEAGVPAASVPVGSRCRVNITVTEPGGRTTKLNAPGNALDRSRRDALAQALLDRSAEGDWVVLAGSLPAGVPSGWYGELTARLGRAGRRVAVDTSGEPLAALLTGAALPHLVKPNSDELASLTGSDPRLLETDMEAAITAAGDLVRRGLDAVLLTLGGAGAALVTADGAWTATPPAVTVASTVGAGDSALAGYLLADAAGLGPLQRLSWAVAYGSAAAALPGTTMPAPDDLDLDGVHAAPYPPLTHRTTTSARQGDNHG